MTATREAVLAAAGFPAVHGAVSDPLAGPGPATGRETGGTIWVPAFRHARVFVTGASYGTSSGRDYATVAYNG